MSISLKKWRVAGMSLVLGVTFIIPIEAACLELPLNYEEKSFLKQSSKTLNTNLLENMSLGSAFKFQGIRSLFAAANSGLKFVRNHPIKALMLGLATIPTANAFSVTNLNQTLSYNVNMRDSSISLLPIIISNAPSSNDFNVIISYPDLAGNLTSKGKASISPLIGVGGWMITGPLTEVNTLTSQLSFANVYNYNITINLYLQIADFTNGQGGAFGQISISPNEISSRTSSSSLTTQSNMATSTNLDLSSEATQGISLFISDSSATSKSSSMAEEDVAPANTTRSNTSSTPSPEIIAGAVAGGLIVMIIGVAVVVRSLHGNHKTSSAAQNNHDSEAQNVIPNQPYDIIPHSPYEACEAPLSSSVSPNGVVRSPYEACEAPLSVYMINVKIPPAQYDAVNAPL